MHFCHILHLYSYKFGSLSILQVDEKSIVLFNVCLIQDSIYCFSNLYFQQIGLLYMLRNST